MILRIFKGIFQTGHDKQKSLINAILFVNNLDIGEKHAMSVVYILETDLEYPSNIHF